MKTTLIAVVAVGFLFVPVRAQAPTQGPAQPAPSSAQAPSEPQAEPQWVSYKVAILQGLDKITARVSQFDAPIDQPVHFGTLAITVRACLKRPPEDPPETAAFLQIDKMRTGIQSTTAKQVFSGWMFASSPAISALEDPVYDVNVLDCKSPTTVAPSSPPAK